MIEYEKKHILEKWKEEFFRIRKEPYSLSEESVADWWLSELEAAEQRRDAFWIEKAKGMREEIEECLYGFDCYPKSGEQADAIIEMLIEEVTKEK